MPLRPHQSFESLKALIERTKETQAKAFAEFKIQPERNTNKRYETDLAECKAYERFVEQKNDRALRKAPHFAAWVAMCESAWSDPVEPIPLLYHEWIEFRNRPHVPTPEEIRTQRLAAGFVEHVVLTPIGIITYDFKPSTSYNSKLSDAEQIQAEATLKDQKLIQILTANPSADLKHYAVALGITIQKIDKIEPKKFGYIPIMEED